MEYDRMYCPSTNEVIFAPNYEEIYDGAEAFIAYWHGEVLDEPTITDDNLATAWQNYQEIWDELLDEFDVYELVEQFLRDYENPEWIVLECTFHGMACGPVSTTVYYVVKADTIIELNPENSDEDEDE